MNTRRILRHLALATATSLALLASAAGAADGLSDQRLQRLDQFFTTYTERGDLPGTVTLVLKDGEVAYKGVHGWRDIESQSPMTEDAIFRIASQTKAIVSVAAMILQEEGRLLIGDPVSRYLPEFAQTQVAVAGEDGAYEVVPAKRAITVRDLLTHTSGVDYGYGTAADAWADAGIQGWYFADRDEPIRETVRRMAALPFDAQPGEEWVYGYSTDILGAVVEVAAGMALDAFLAERIFTPLGMTDTHFYLPADKTGRLATVYAVTEDGSLARSPAESNMTGQGGYVEGPRKSLSAGAGLLSTAHDYARFLQMLANEGELDGARVLSRKSVQLMTVNHLADPSMYPWDAGMGFGLGFKVTLDVGVRGVPSSVGDYAWGGAYHSTYWVDPAEGLVVVYFTQVIPSGNLDDHAKLRTLIYQALE
ncbi:beta-lactamase family protein [Marinihelvus fidelis]|uniref:Beta-lactamase family protein n=1 Tax=Marinihelvus fidelis TaxID=2613842 RepID=A0A5N0TDG8_9GAMM|nr:serine hydrolase domain-containing protein [Marinihelvus fidelis]KAA9132738.1 beta-lactamase family protein [Marinihelvus fidelis]